MKMKYDYNFYIQGLLEEAEKYAWQLSNYREAPFDVEERLIKDTTYLYDLNMHLAWGALQALLYADVIKLTEYEDYGKICERIENIADGYYDEK